LDGARGRAIVAAATVEDAMMSTAKKLQSSRNKTARRKSAVDAGDEKSVAKAKKTARTKAMPVAKPVKPAAVEKSDDSANGAKKSKLLRDSYRMPKSDFELLRSLKARAREFGLDTRKSELIRAGLHCLESLSDAKLKAALDTLSAEPGKAAQS
jgi:hypothetical protein